MSRIYWDTMLFVYWLEDHPRYAKRLRQVLRKIKRDTTSSIPVPSRWQRFWWVATKRALLRPHVTFARSFVRPPWK